MKFKRLRQLTLSLIPMMKKPLAFSLLFFFILSSLSAWEWERPVGYLEGQVSYFYPLSKKMRKIYKEGWVHYEVRTHQTFKNGWGLWQAVGWGNDVGKTTHHPHHRSKLQVLALRLGLQYQYCLTPCLRLYLGGSLNYNFLRIRERSYFFRSRSTDKSFGVLAQTGLYYLFWNQFFLDVNLEYVYQNFKFSHRRHYSFYENGRCYNLSGIKAGLGLGIIF